MTEDKILYEDEDVIASLPYDAMALGHIRVTTKKPIKNLEDVGDKLFEHIFYVASYAATCLFEYLGAQGSNIICNNVEFVNKHFVIDVVARKQDDGINFSWTPKQQPPEEMDKTAAKIKDKADLIGHEKPKTEPVEEKKEEIDSNNYLVKQLNRLP